jgi:hypothetical protein
VLRFERRLRASYLPASRRMSMSMSKSPVFCFDFLVSSSRSVSSFLARTRSAFYAPKKNRCFESSGFALVSPYCRAASWILVSPLVMLSTSATLHLVVQQMDVVFFLLFHRRSYPAVLSCLSCGWARVAREQCTRSNKPIGTYSSEYRYLLGDTAVQIMARSRQWHYLLNEPKCPISPC